MRRKGNNKLDWRSDWLPLALVLLLSAAYFLCFFNRFAGLRSGDGEFGGGVAFLAGLRPYRDYFTAGPPLNVFKSALQLAVFGKMLIVSRTLAVLERLLIATTVYLWLRRLFTRSASALASLLAIIVSAGDHTDPLASYNHDAIFLAILCGFCAAHSLSAQRPRSVALYAALAGFCGGLSLLTKQTVGGAVIVAVVLCCVLAQTKLRAFAGSLPWLLTFLLGACVPVIATMTYLWHLGALRACLDMMFVSGPKAKATHPFIFLAREIMIAGLFRWWLLLGIALTVVCAKAFARSVSGPQRAESVPVRGWLIVSICFAMVVVVASMQATRGAPVLENTGKAAVYFVLLGTIVVGVNALQHAFHAEGTNRQRAFEITLFSVVSLSIALSLSLSFPAFEAMVLPGLALLVAAAFDGVIGKARIAGTALGGLLLFFQVTEKLALPFGFDHQDEQPVSESTYLSDDPTLKGMRFPIDTVRFLDAAQKTVQERAGANDTIFTYPELGLLYSLTGRYPPTRTASHNIDVVEDSFARSEASRLLAAPPAVLFFAKPSEEDMRIAELVWRQGHKSGQRNIIAAVEQIATTYDLIGTYRLAPQDTPISIYARPLRAAPALVPLEQ